MADKSGGIIDNGVLLVENDRIKAVGRAGELAIPAGAKTVDVTGKTIIPGLVDAHAHGPHGVDEMTPQQNWVNMLNLAMGITTRHDPSSSAATAFPAVEMQRAGLIIGPRRSRPARSSTVRRRPTCMPRSTASTTHWRMSAV